MAEEKKKGYPKIPRANWFLLRDKFKQRTPERVSPSYVASALSMGEASASANIIPPLRAFGLIDDAGKPSDLAYDWRDDTKYAEVCKQILEATYPQELRDLFHDASAPAKNVESWFARDAKVGQAAARAYAATFLMLLEADLAKAKEQNGSKPKTTNAAGKPSKATAPAKAAKAVPAAAAPTAHEVAKPVNEHGGSGDDGGGRRGFSPKLHVDIQIHISPDSSPEQIDKIFESMAKHLPLKG
ncbi:DUF5343 domain-containing protein [Acidovorax sp. IB03]|uniref:DUF5343 domain-containing protein n=1 Tax=Acidovorax sp. IB03 TaxID=2779366 RepID=UPI0018E8DD3B|nr:DUF5343 domain-containing protein [Acidovorax sp. IB03]MBJ2165668.1 DUF5343 domain-containing protein [Acidovorax sp. IB03]